MVLSRIITTLFLTPFILYAASDEFCATVTPNNDYLDSIGVLSYITNPTPKNISVFFHIIRPSVGQAGVTNQQVDDYLNILNNDYNLGNIYFEEVGRQIIRNDDYFNNASNTFGELRTNYAHENALDIFLIGPGGAGNAGTIPSTSLIFGMDWIGTSVISHEVGHCFNLYHTHETSFCPESTTGTDCDTCGDLVCDTPADPDLQHGACVDTNYNYIPGICYVPPDPEISDPYNPDTHNIMSYTKIECLDWFTPGQFARAHTSLDSIEMINKLIIKIETPHNLTWLNSNNHPLLSWNPVPDQNLSGYAVYRNLNGSNVRCFSYQHIADIPSDQTSYYDVTVDISHPRFASNNAEYFVTALNYSSEESFHSNIITVPTSTSVKVTYTNLLQNQWRNTGALNIPRAGHTATLLPDGTILVVGGRYFDGVLKTTNSCELFDPATGIWSFVDSLHQGRLYYTTTLLNDGRVLVVGGSTPQGVTTQCELYDPLSNTWLVTESLSEARESHEATLLNDGRVLVTGGHYTFAAGEWTLASCEIYDPATDTWQGASPMNSARGDHRAVLLPNNKVLVVGGRSVFGVPVLSAEIYNPGTDSWEIVDSLQFSRTDLSATLLPDGRVLVAGSVEQCEVFDPLTNSFSLAAATLFLRQFGHRAILQGNGRVLLTGTHIECEEYDPLNDAWSLVSSLPTLRNHHTLTPLGNGEILLAGGSVIDSTCYIYTPDTTVSVVNLGAPVPSLFSVWQNYPNPFNSSSIIKYYLPQKGNVTLTIVDVYGRRLERVILGNLEAGYHRYLLNMGDRPSGVYVYQLEGNGVRVARKMVLVK